MTSPFALSFTAKAVRLITALTVALSPAVAPTADRPFNEKAALKVLDDFVAEYKVYATCQSLMPDMVPIVYESWHSQFLKTKENLSLLKPTKLFLARLVLAEATPLIDDRMSLGEARKLCTVNEKAVERFHIFGFSNLSSDLLKAK